MSDIRALLERKQRELHAPPGSLERLLRRRDGKRRNQRVAAGVVGVAVFVAAIWIVTSGGPADRSETSIVHGGGGTGAAETGPTETGTEPTAPPEAGWDGQGLPPEGAVPSKPEEGRVVAEFHDPDAAPILDDPRGGWVWVYADGRVLSMGGGSGSFFVTERRLTPKGVELVRSATVQSEVFRLSSLPADAWKDAEDKPFVPSRYAFCYKPASNVFVAPSQADMSLFPAPARAILSAAELTPPQTGDTADYPPCSQVTTDEARTLWRILSDVGGWEMETMLPHGKRLWCAQPFSCA